MKPTGHKRGPVAIDVTGWLLGGTIIALAVVDLLIWATLSNVPNPGSKFLLQQTPQDTSRAGRDDLFGADEARPQPASLSRAVPQSRPLSNEP
jgi:hypothetical protein